MTGEPILKKGEMIDKMIRLAVKGHAGQFDKGGNPYILHVLKVMDNLHTNDEELQCIAVGHDLIEDTKITAKELEKDPELTQAQIQLIYDTELITQQVCGAPTGDDGLLLKIAQAPNQVEEE